MPRENKHQQQSHHQDCNIKTELEATINMRLDGFKYETVRSFDIKLPAITLNKLSSYYDQPSCDLIKWSLLKSPEKSLHASQFIKHISSSTLEDNTILHIQKWWDDTLSTL